MPIGQSSVQIDGSKTAINQLVGERTGFIEQDSVATERLEKVERRWLMRIQNRERGGTVESRMSKVVSPLSIEREGVLSESSRQIADGEVVTDVRHDPVDPTAATQRPPRSSP